MSLTSERLLDGEQSDESGFATDLPSVVARLKAAKSTLKLSDLDVARNYWSMHPRVRFFKTLAANAALLDIGANTGGLIVHKDWPDPPRPDISLYGADMMAQEAPDALKYAGWARINLDNEMPSYPGVRFDGILMSHLIEHLKKPEELLRWIAQNASPVARLYIEWPSPHTARLPSRDALRNEGIDVVLSNFNDDPTHKDPLTKAQIEAWLAGAGFRTITSGEIDAGIFGDELVARGIGANNSNFITMGYWSISRWASFIVAEPKGR
jgi:2-polyprenyl-3-methyl-5-hydroxy-6-metoxy-1,4-benzoquinol methylase